MKSGYEKGVSLEVWQERIRNQNNSGESSSLLAEKCGFCKANVIIDIIQEGDIVYAVCPVCKGKSIMYGEERIND